jgi:mono/diheme cytochrome c family protein
MTQVVHNLRNVPESEVRAISAYLATIMGAPDSERQKRAEAVLAMARAANAAGGDDVPEPAKQPHAASDAAAQSGATLYAGSCAICHGASERAPGAASANALHLSLSSSLSLSTPGNLIRIVLQGMAPPDGERGSFMPGYSGAFTDAQVAAIATYLRAAYTDRPAWKDVEREVRKQRQQLARE